MRDGPVEQRRGVVRTAERDRADSRGVQAVADDVEDFLTRLAQAVTAFTDDGELTDL